MKNNFVAIFDLDYTLWNHVPIEEQSMRITEYLQIPFSKEFVKQISDFWEGHCLEGKKISRELVASMIEKHIPYLRLYGRNGEDLLDSMRVTGKISLNEGALSLLNFLKNNGITIIAYTDWFLEEQYELMERFGIREFFDEVFSWEGTYQKPSKVRMEEIVSKFPGKRFIYIGDSLSRDMLSASYIEGCVPIWYRKEAKENSLPIHYDTDDLNTIIPVLEEL